jgi:AcrR family transcriptional regulator
VSIEPPEEILASRLPTGRHGLPRQTVLANQRQRLLAAAARAVVEVGYGDLSVQDITSRASISRVTFYQLFERKADCLLAAFDQALEDLLEAASNACSAQPQWPQSVVAAVGAAVDFAISSPAEAGLLTAGAVEPELAARARGASQGLAKMLAGARPPSEQSGQLPAMTEELLIGGAGSVIASHLTGKDRARLAELAPQLAQLILTPYLGPAEAARHVAATNGGTG